MKKKKSLETLSLHRETLRNLSEPRLLGVLGAATGFGCEFTFTCTCTNGNPNRTAGTDCCD